MSLITQFTFFVSIIKNFCEVSHVGRWQVALCQSFSKRLDYLAINHKNLKNPNALKN